MVCHASKLACHTRRCEGGVGSGRVVAAVRVTMIYGLFISVLYNVLKFIV